MKRCGEVWRIVGVLLAPLLFTNAANAQVYDFGRFLSGGGGGQDPRTQRIVGSMGAYVCLGVQAGSEPGMVRFLIWSRIPQPKGRISAIAFDLGRHNRLLKGISVAMGSPTVKGRVVPPQAHPFLAGMSPEFWVDVEAKGHHVPDGLGPGRMIVINGFLGDGVTITQLLEALHEGLHPSQGVNGFRVGVIMMWLLGGPPPGVATIQDDGGFVTAGTGQACGS